jgi:alcohol dehydrogenase class IV
VSSEVPVLISSLRKYVTPEIVVGEGALEMAGRYAQNFGAEKTLLVTDPGLIQAGWATRVGQSLEKASVSYVVFDGVTPNPKDHEVMAGVELYRREGCDVIVAVGGGSPMDCAKGIGVVASNGRHVLEFEGVDEVSVPGPPLICVPTTAGSSADVSQFAIITDTRRQLKITIISKTVVPDVSLVDPQTTTTMSKDLTIATGLDALSHAFEAYVSTANSPLTDVNALAAVALIVRHLPQVVRKPDNMEYRSGMMTASLLAGLAFSNAGLGAVHAMAHALGGNLDLPHGACNALLLRSVVEFNFSAAAAAYIRLGEAMGLHLSSLPLEEAKAALLGKLAALHKDVQWQGALCDFGLAAERIPGLARLAAADPCLSTNPRPVTIEDVEAIYARALCG